MLVVVYHVWLSRVSGGVDVFFFLSGFLLTGQLVRAAESDGIGFAALWARMIKRLFPAALVVLAATMAVSILVLPENRWLQTIKEAVAAALYLENWQLAADSADYFNQHDEASVVQHFWSLSIQGQFYLVWPLLIAVAALIGARVAQSVRTSAAWCLAVVFAASLTYSIILTETHQQLAYFHSLTRVWEFALGGMLALVIESVALPRWSRVVLGWAGVVGLVACGLVLQVGTVFPGHAALWPTLCAAAVVTAGTTGSRLGADRWLNSRPLHYIGDLSYALYLWHWPVLVFYLVLRERTAVGLAGGSVIIAVSFALAVLTYHLVEHPVRESRVGTRSRWGAYALGATMLVPVLVAAGLWNEVSVRKARTYASLVADPDHPGALVRQPGFEFWGNPDAALVPPLVALPRDFAAIEGATCTRAAHNTVLEICTSPVSPPATKRIVVVGDSHMQQYLAALAPIARRHNWQIIHMLKGACPFSVDADSMPGDRECIKWNADAAQEIIRMKPDAVFTNGSRNVRVGLTEETPSGFVAQWRKLEEAEIPVVAARDNPRHSFSPPQCAATYGREAPQCSVPRADLLAPEAPYSLIEDLPGNTSFVDFSDYFCTEDLCPPQIGNVQVYLDDNHVSGTYMGTMSPIVEEALLAQLADLAGA
ncbi:Peptidoglycan/LPS O-acetylase OafA/YrhL, contains acyltransferase and SGNH-hydrolase domains [Lentzea xinjiangensis]|uniref:Peptidoglycan/LPS O-acetylase OafA/YrhL, contains acyltransferase and SGNH-hydrolase domains n=1 Tax=Lentzea xinjiangensis TaxID=402600 RepID=A0A1H9W8Z7_9PSEU|nr:Peptidoglycan/LPS O-acetylase OafA/YrhL, contains acyltransferase and SGNH-hydrolase domains [Lentzea xinjiangensis]